MIARIAGGDTQEPQKILLSPKDIQHVLSVGERKKPDTAKEGTVIEIKKIPE